MNGKPVIKVRVEREKEADGAANRNTTKQYLHCPQNLSQVCIKTKLHNKNIFVLYVNMVAH